VIDFKVFKVIGRTVSIVPPCVVVLGKDQYRRRASVLKELEEMPEGDYSALRTILDEDDKAIEPKAYQLTGPTNFKGGEIFFCNQAMSKMNRTLVADVGAMEIWESDSELQARYNHDLNAYLDEIEADEAVGEAEESQAGKETSEPPEAGNKDVAQPEGDSEADKAAHIKKIAETINGLKEDAFNDDLSINVKALGDIMEVEVTADDALEAYYTLFIGAVKTLNPDDFTQDSGPKVEAISKAIGFDMVADERNELWARYQKEANEALSA